MRDALRHNRLLQATLACLVAGTALLFPFDAPATLTLGVLLLVAFIVVGVFTIATPDYLAGLGDGDAARTPREPEEPEDSPGTPTGG